LETENFPPNSLRQNLFIPPKKYFPSNFFSAKKKVPAKQNAFKNPYNFFLAENRFTRDFKRVLKDVQEILKGF